MHLSSIETTAAIAIVVSSDTVPDFSFDLYDI